MNIKNTGKLILRERPRDYRKCSCQEIPSIKANCMKFVEISIQSQLMFACLEWDGCMDICVLMEYNDP